MYKHFVAFSAVCLFHKNRVSPSEIAYLVNDIRHSPLKYGLLKYTRTPLEQKYGMKWQMDCLHVIHILSQYQSEATTIIYKCYKIRTLCTFSVLQFNSCVIIMFLAFHQAFSREFDNNDERCLHQPFYTRRKSLRNRGK